MRCVDIRKQIRLAPSMCPSSARQGYSALTNLIYPPIDFFGVTAVMICSEEPFPPLDNAPNALIRRALERGVKDK